MKSLNYSEGIFKSKWFSKFINKISLCGKKSNIEKIIYYTLYLFKKKKRYYPLFFFFEVLEKIKPALGLKISKYKQVSKKNNVIITPYILNVSLQYKKSIFWLTKSIKLRKENQLFLKIYFEFSAIIFNKINNSIIKKKNYYKYIILFKTIKNFKW